VLRHGSQRAVHADGGEVAGVTAAAVRDRTSGGPRVDRGDEVHVGDVGADVGRRDVGAVHRRDEPRVGQHELGSPVVVRVTHDDRLAAAVGQSGEGVLVRHRTREVEHVGQRGALVGVRHEPRATERRTEGGRVDRHDRVQPDGLVVADEDLLVGREGLGQRHGGMGHGPKARTRRDGTHRRLVTRLGVPRRGRPPDPWVTKGERTAHGAMPRGIVAAGPKGPTGHGRCTGARAVPRDVHEGGSHGWARSGGG
jgi:hypothetical protein